MNHPLLGDMVVWDEAVYPTLVEGMISCYGKGPFKVVGLRLHRKGAQSRCPYAISIELSDNDHKEFAGEWFKKVPRAKTKQTRGHSFSKPMPARAFSGF